MFIVTALTSTDKRFDSYDEAIGHCKTITSKTSIEHSVVKEIALCKKVFNVEVTEKEVSR